MPSRPLPDVAGGYLSRVAATWEGLPSDNLFAWELLPAPATGSADISAAGDINTAIAAHWPAFAVAFSQNSYATSEVSTYPLHTPTHPAVVLPFVATGTVSGDPSPAPVAALIKHTVVRRGRGSQGRTFLSPFPLNEITADGKSLSSAYIAAVDTAFTTFINAVETDVATATGSACFYSQLSKIPPGKLYAIDSSSVEAALSTQRRRTRRP